ncbi:MAG TPA: ATP-binding protein [Burkholderiaceae bacterium]|nr:ATP-binding protein [Burkholderiaceae bacterium]
MNASASPAPAARRRWRRAALWGLLIALLAVAQALLVFLVVQYENQRAQDRTDAAASAVADEARQVIARATQALQGLSWSAAPQATTPERWREGAARLLGERPEILRIERRDAEFQLIEAVQAPHTTLFSAIARAVQSNEARAACADAERSAAPTLSRSYFTPLGGGQGLEVVDLCLPPSAGVPGPWIATVSLPAVLEAALAADPARGHEATFVESDGARLARAGRVRGAGVYRAERVVDAPGLALQLRLDSAEGRPALIPNLSVALVVGLSIALTALVLLLARDGRRRAAAEERLADALALRRAMEDSLVTGLRARDIEGRISYVNPAFCRMVGFTADELLAAAQPPYWPPERVREYEARMASGAARTDALGGRETEFMRANGERFPVMVYEAPLVDAVGRQRGWMSAVVDLTEQRRAEELARAQQERLQATARLATVGEMASLLSHELNQPLAAIASYASGSLNLLDAPHVPAEDRDMLRQAVARIAEQAERAGRTIQSVHDFVRRREHAHEAVAPSRLVDAVLPLVRLQARKSGTRIELDLPPALPSVMADRTMIEQVLLNLTRNGIQAMETEATPAASRVLHIAATLRVAGWVEFAIADAGPGIAPDVAARLFTPFFTTRAEGMGLGLSLCRTVIEQHGGALDFSTGAGGTTFRFTLRSA